MFSTDPYQAPLSVQASAADGTAASSADLAEELQQWSLRLHFFMFDTVGRLYIRHMFDITVDFPESVPAVEDMCTCLSHTNLHARFIDTLRESLCSRLLHAGALPCSPRPASMHVGSLGLHYSCEACVALARDAAIVRVAHGLLGASVALGCAPGCCVSTFSVRGLEQTESTCSLLLTRATVVQL